MAYPGQGHHHHHHSGYGGPPPMAGMPSPGPGYNQPGYYERDFAPPSGGPPPGYGGGGWAPPPGPPPNEYGGGGYASPPGPPRDGYAPPPGPPGAGYAPPSGPPPMQYEDGPIGPPEYQNAPARFELPTNNQMGDFRWEYSNCTGRRKALLIGINYVGQKAELRGCWNDVENVKRFITSRYGYEEDDIVVLTDAARDFRSQPTRQNMTAAMHWLVRDARPHDSLFFHYSGHGGQAPATEGDEEDGMNETIIPVDYQVAGEIEDDELHAIMVRPLPIGCRLTAIFDSCHSGTALDLPYIYSTSGKIKEPNLLADAGKGILGAGMSYARGDIGGALMGLLNTGKQAISGNRAEEICRATRSSGADAISFSGCKDNQTSADATEGGQATGAMSWAFIQALTQYPQLTYMQLLNCVRDILRSKYSQRPQLSASHPFDVNLVFRM